MLQIKAQAQYKAQYVLHSKYWNNSSRSRKQRALLQYVSTKCLMVFDCSWSINQITFYIGFFHQGPIQPVTQTLLNCNTVLIGYYDYHLMTLAFACFISFQHEKRKLEVI